jgi:DUF4097 and DUF4098 domain-containing protein YvlB
MRLSLSPSVRIVAAVAASACFAACEVNLNTEGLSAIETRKFAVSGTPQVELDTFDGAIEVHSWDRPEVEVEIEKRAMEQSLIDAIQIEIRQDGDKVVVKVTGPVQAEHRGLTIGTHISPTARLRVALPRASHLNARSGDGAIRAEAIDGTIHLITADGSVTASRLSGDLHIRTGDGSIRLDNVSGRIDLETTDGGITVDASPSKLLAKTGDGSIRATIDPDAVMAEDWDLSTGDGSVVLTLPSAFNAELDVETSDGTVRATHPLLSEEPGRRESEDGGDRRERRRILRSRMGEGGKTLRVRTGDGTIRIVR